MVGCLTHRPSGAMLPAGHALPSEALERRRTGADERLASNGRNVSGLAHGNTSCQYLTFRSHSYAGASRLENSRAEERSGTHVVARNEQPFQLLWAILHSNLSSLLGPQLHLPLPCCGLEQRSFLESTRDNT